MAFNAGEFASGSGVNANDLTMTIVSLASVATLLWAAWVVISAFRTWMTGKGDFYDFMWSTLRAAAVILVLGFFLRPDANGSGGDFLSIVKSNIKAIGLIMGLVISVGGMLWVAWAGLAKFNDARIGRAEWGEVGLLTVIGASILLFSGYLLKVASTVFT